VKNHVPNEAFFVPYSYCDYRKLVKQEKKRAGNGGVYLRPDILRRQNDGLKYPGRESENMKKTEAILNGKTRRKHL
jgi:hypothetical protein